MATNPYFKQGVRSEQNVYEDIIIEALQMYGQDVYYLPREIVNKDSIFLDDIPSRFGSAYKIEMYIENTEAFDGEGDLFTKFGIELRDQANFIVSRKRWKQLVGARLAETANFRPREGDLIFLSLSKSIFEIRKVETESPFFQLQNLPTFRMQCELFEYSDEDFDTDVVDIDMVEGEGAFQYSLTLDSSGLYNNIAGTTGTSFTIGEKVLQTFTGYDMAGEITRWSDSDKILHIGHAGATDGKYHVFVTGRSVTGQSSGRVAKPTLVAELQEIQKDAQNKTFNDFEADFLDFSESNPFGDL
jgi:hypothetical protein